MKKLLAMLTVLAMLASGFAVLAEEIDLTGYSDEQLGSLENAIGAERDRRANESGGAADGQMEAPKDVPVESQTGEANNDPLLDSFEPIKQGSRGDNVIALQTKLIELGFLKDMADGIFGPKSIAALKELQKAMGKEETGEVDGQEYLDELLNVTVGDGVNLAVGTSSEWSEWMTPSVGTENVVINFAHAYLGDKQVGERYACHVEIEFKDVTASDTEKFGFHAQGAVDGAWDIGNIWNTTLVNLSEAPANGVYKYTSVQKITDKNVSAERFDLNFRCDFWASGSFRVRNIKVEKGAIATEWCISEREVGDGVNLAIGTSSEWSEWMTPEYNIENSTFYVAYAYLGDKQVGDVYTCSMEIEFADVTATEGNEDQKFRFWAQGATDGQWIGGNVWNSSLISLNETPADGVIKCVATAILNENGANATQFNLGFRCDYWASGSFRVRNVKVEKGNIATEWCISEREVGDGVNLAIGTSSEWSEWMTPEYNIENSTFNVAYAYLGDKQVGDVYTCSMEIEFTDVTATEGNEDQKFRFWAQGATDGQWIGGNVWNPSLISLNETPADGVVKCVATAILNENGANATQFNLGFRCDYWASGSFRVRNVKVEKGNIATEWSLAPYRVTRGGSQ